MTTPAWINILAQLLEHNDWNIVAAPWQGKDVVFDLVAIPAHGSGLWALRLFDAHPSDQALELMQQDLLSEGSATTGLIIGPIDTHCICIDDASFDEEAAYIAIQLAGQARQMAWAL